MSPELTIRAFSNDQYILDKVFYSNFYRLKPRTDGEKNVIVDIGAHCGYFAFAAMALGGKKVYSFEPFLENYRILLKNTEQAETGTIIPHQLGVYPQASNIKFSYPTYKDQFYDFANIEIDKNEGQQHTAPCITLDEILQEYVQEPTVDILKISVGYAESDILLNSHLLSRKVNAVCGEAVLDQNGTQKLQDAMMKKGFTDSYFATLKEEDKILFLFAKDSCDKYFTIPKEKGVS